MYLDLYLWLELLVLCAYFFSTIRRTPVSFKIMILILSTLMIFSSFNIAYDPYDSTLITELGLVWVNIGVFFLNLLNAYHEDYLSIDGGS